MRHVRFLLRNEEGPFELVGREVPAGADLAPEALLHLNRLQDGTSVALYLLRGDPDVLRAVFDDSANVLSYDLFNTDGDRFHAHVHARPHETVEDLLDLIDDHRLTVVPPIEFVDLDALRVGVAGDQTDIQRATAATPEHVTVRLERAGDYDPDYDPLASALTRRQQEVLETAVDLGYYDVPRTATQADIAAELDCSAGTVGEHLRKIHATVMTELVGRS